MQQELDQLRLNVVELQEDVKSLNSEVVRLRREVARLKLAEGVASDSRTPPRTPQRVASESGYISEDSYSLVSERGDRAAPPRLPGSSRSSSGIASGAGTTGQGTRSELTWKQREDIADQIGRFFERSISGAHRGPSGRERNPLASRCWVVVRDYAGQIYSPVRVFRTWTPAAELVKPGRVADPGDSIFCGFPSEREAKRAVEVGGLDWPSVIEG